MNFETSLVATYCPMQTTHCKPTPKYPNTEPLLCNAILAFVVLPVSTGKEYCNFYNNIRLMFSKGILNIIFLLLNDCQLNS